MSYDTSFHLMKYPIWYRLKIPQNEYKMYMTLYKRKKLGMLKMLNIIILELLDKKKLMEIL